MRVECAWCGKHKGDVEPLEDESVTHGICQGCREQVFGAFREKRLKAKQDKEVSDADGEVHGTEGVA